MSQGLTVDLVVSLFCCWQAKALLTDDYGKDLASVEALIRRHEELERDLTAIEDKLEVSARDEWKGLRYHGDNKEGSCNLCWFWFVLVLVKKLQITVG